MKKRYTKIGDCIKKISLLHGKTLKQSMVDKKIDEKETSDLRTIYN